MALDTINPNPKDLPYIFSRIFFFLLYLDYRSNNDYYLITGPAEKEEAFYDLKDEDNQYIHHNRHGRSRITHKTTMENWENAKVRYSSLRHR